MLSKAALAQPIRVFVFRRQENFDLDEGRDFCPRCAYPVCWPALAMYRDSIRDPPW